MKNVIVSAIIGAIAGFVAGYAVTKIAVLLTAGPV